MSYYGFRPYVPVAKRRMLAARKLEKLKKKGHIVSPVVIDLIDRASSRGVERGHCTQRDR